jgi:N-succinyldiaminopimelate aminotransferase
MAGGGGVRLAPTTVLPKRWIAVAPVALRISSVNKTFCCTGWKIGWVTGPASLISAALQVKQFLTFVNGAPLQPAVAVALGLPDRPLHFRAGLQSRRERLVVGLTDAGFGVLTTGMVTR